MAATYRLNALTIQRGPPMRVFAEVMSTDDPFSAGATVEITDATTLANLAGASIFTRIFAEINAKLPGRNVT